MQQFTRSILLTTLFIFCFYNFLFGQIDTSYISDIRIFVKYLDSISKLNYSQVSDFTTSISDGIIKTNDITVGGFDIYTLSKAKRDTVLRIAYDDNLDINTYKTYYFKSNKLVYAILELHNAKSKILFKKKEFYRDDKLIWAGSQKNPNRYIYQTSFSLFDDGQKFLLDYFENSKYFR